MAKTRARTKIGAFVADDPNTPENEAWVDSSPKKPSKYSYGINSKKDFPPPGTTKHKMMVLSGEIKE
tara:strand:+ start:9778 stop:9978 length:201 start_codon:yes stop_codon:yes gene_type:complete